MQSHSTNSILNKIYSVIPGKTVEEKVGNYNYGPATLVALQYATSANADGVFLFDITSHIITKFLLTNDIGLNISESRAAKISANIINGFRFCQIISGLYFGNSSFVPAADIADFFNHSLNLWAINREKAKPEVSQEERNQQDYAAALRNAYESDAHADKDPVASLFKF